MHYSCGCCIMTRMKTRTYRSMVGAKFGRLTIVAYISGSRQSRSAFECLCLCGRTSIVSCINVASGSTTSCGCYARQKTSERSTAMGAARRAKARKRHGIIGNEFPPEFRSWRAMIDRCTRKAHVGFHRYGGRGITICERWMKSFASFYADMGQMSGPGLSLDRINPNGNYEPGNCRWATKQQQSRNTSRSVSLTFGGVTAHVMCWAELTGISRSVLARRKGLGWSDERTLTTAVKAR